MYAQYTPSEVFDLRCEFDVPRFLDLNQLDSINESSEEYLLMGAYDIELQQYRQISQEEEFF